MLAILPQGLLARSSQACNRPRVLQGGESGVFTPMHLLVFRKKADTDSASERPASDAGAVKASDGK